MNIDIRKIVAADQAGWRACFCGFWAHFGTVIDEAIYVHTWARILDPAEEMFAIGVFNADMMLGLAHVVPHRSFSALGKDYYLQHLFVMPEARRDGLGRALIQAVYDIARAEGGHRVYWNTPADNLEARRLYDQVASNTGYALYRKNF